MTILEDTSSIHINAFARYISINSYRYGHFFVSDRYVKREQVDYFIDHKPESITFSYFYSPVKRHEKIFLESLPSNLGKGCVWYFVCPVSQKRCKKLYFIGGCFVHREAFKSVYYENQVMSHRRRSRNKEVSTMLRGDKKWETLKSKRLTLEYNGKFTKRWVQIRNIARKTDEGQFIINPIIE